MTKFSFRIGFEDAKSGARVGEIKTPHGRINTPAYVPVATNASVKSLTSDDMEELNAEILFANTFHLYLRPGNETIEAFDGLHNFMKWNKPIITDSGGFQAFSLGYGLQHGVGKISGNVFPDENPVKPKSRTNIKKFAFINDDGIIFRSPYDGKKVFLTPQLSIEIQKILGADIILALDECTSPLSDYEYTKKAMIRTHRWAQLSLDSRTTDQAIFGIIQGGEYKDLREESAKFISSLPFDGIAIGGSLGKSKKDMHNILDWTIPLLPYDKPRHLLGIGYVDDLFNCIEKGVDMFDCVIPTRLGRAGFFFVPSEEGGNVGNKFRIDIQRSKFKDDKKSVSESCKCYTCSNFSKAYLRHLYVAKELTFYRLVSLHNMNFFLRLMEKIRESIKENSFNKLKNEWLK